MALMLENPDLAADGAACWVVKDEVVRVEFALTAGLPESAVGLNRYAVGDYLLRKINVRPTVRGRNVKSRCNRLASG
jgi:hypothetical protein